LETHVVGDLFLSHISAFGQLFLGAFAKLRKATVPFAMSVRPFAVRMEQLGFPLDGFL
jgi:hypothetical protein